MRYKISWGKVKTNKWGRILSSTSHDEYASTLAEAMARANTLSLKHKKYDILILDLEGPQEDSEDANSTIWLVASYKNGSIYLNPAYFDAKLK